MVNWISVRDMLTLIIFRELNTKYVGFVLAYTYSDVKSEIFMELRIVFLIEGDHAIEWFIRPNKIYMT